MNWRTIWLFVFFKKKYVVDAQSRHFFIFKAEQRAINSVFFCQDDYQFHHMFAKLMFQMEKIPNKHENWLTNNALQGSRVSRRPVILTRLLIGLSWRWDVRISLLNIDNVKIDWFLKAGALALLCPPSLVGADIVLRLTAWGDGHHRRRHRHLLSWLSPTHVQSISVIMPE